MSKEVREHNASALGKALFWSCLVPSLLCSGPGGHSFPRRCGRFGGAVLRSGLSCNFCF